MHGQAVRARWAAAIVVFRGESRYPKHHSRAFLNPDSPQTATPCIIFPQRLPHAKPTQRPPHHAQRLAPSQYKALGSGLARNATLKKLSFAGSHMGDRALQVSDMGVKVSHMGVEVRHMGDMALQVSHMGVKERHAEEGLPVGTHGGCFGPSKRIWAPISPPRPPTVSPPHPSPSSQLMRHGLQENASLEELDLTACDLTDGGAACMASIVKARGEKRGGEEGEARL